MISPQTVRFLSNVTDLTYIDDFHSAIAHEIIDLTQDNMDLDVIDLTGEDDVDLDALMQNVGDMI